MIEVFLKIVYDYSDVYVGYTDMTRIYIDPVENDLDISIKKFSETTEMIDMMQIDGQNEEVYKITKQEFSDKFNTIKRKLNDINI